jgi:hypothetical protein
VGRVKKSEKGTMKGIVGIICGSFGCRRVYMPETVKQLPGPYEIFELGNGESRELTIVGFETGEVTIHPAHLPSGKTITALRVHVPKELKPLPPHYWDITSKTLVAQVLPYLEVGGYQGKTFVIHKHGVAPKARFTLEVKP